MVVLKCKIHNRGNVRTGYFKTKGVHFELIIM